MAKTKRKAMAKLLSDGTLMLYGVIGDEWDGLTASEVVEHIRSLGEVDEINVLLNSPGGSVTDGLAIYNELATHPASVNIEITGLAASMGSVIAMAGDHVRIAENAMVMIHNPWNVAVGNSEDLRKAADVLDKFGTSLVGIYVQRTGLEEDDVRSMMDEETWLDAEEALAKGFVDEIGSPVEASALAESGIDDDRLTKALGIHAVPAALTRIIQKERNMKTGNNAGAGGQPEPTGMTPDQVQAAIKEAIAQAKKEANAEEVDRVKAIQDLAEKAKLGAKWALGQIVGKVTLEDARAAAFDTLASRQEGQGPSPIPGGASITADERDKFMAGAGAWLIQKAGKAQLVEKHTGEKVDAGEFRGMSLLDLARETVVRAGGNPRGMSKMELAGAALGRGGFGASMNTRSDFPVLLENVLHKMLLAAYGTIPDTWSRFCATGSVSDFRPHLRLRMGSFSRLDSLNEAGEFIQKHMPDAEKQTISASTKGNIVGLTRQAIVNDDVDGFSRLITMLGRAAALSIEVDVYATLALNSGLGPDLSDGNPLFHNRGTGQNNIGTGSALGVDALDADRVVMASMKDQDGNEFLDLRPAVLVLPIGLGGQARVVNDAQYDVDAIDSGTDEQNKFMQPNKVRGLFRDIVDTPRLSGTRRYLFADPAIAPVMEVVFLDGQSSPVLETEEGFDYDGVRWRVRHDYGVGATDYRGAVTNAGG